LAYARSINVLYLVDDNGDALLAGQVLNTSGTLNNSQCTVTWGASPVTSAGNNLALALTIAFTQGLRRRPHLLSRRARRKRPE